MAAFFYHSFERLIPPFQTLFEQHPQPGTWWGKLNEMINDEKDYIISLKRTPESNIFRKDFHATLYMIVGYLGFK